MAIMRTNRLTSKTTPPQKRKMTSASELEAQDAAFKSANQNYEAQMDFYKNVPKGAKSYASFSGGSIDVSPEGLAQYNKNRRSNVPEVTRIERPRSSGSEADFLKKAISDDSQFMGHVTYKEPTKPTNKPADWSTVQLDKMSVGKAKITVPKGKLKVTEKEEYAFNPATRGTKTKTKTSAALTGGGDKLVRAKNPSGKLGAARVTETEKKGKLGYNREKALFEAKAGTSVSGRDFSNMSAAEIKSKRAELKQDRRDYRKSSLDYDVKAPSIKEATMDIRQARKAEIYTRKAEAGKLSHFTPEYKRDENKQGVNRIEAFKGSIDNATNRNTMKAKLDAISSKKSNKTNMY